LEGLTVTGFSRKQLGMDAEVLRFYRITPWISLGSSYQQNTANDLKAVTNLSTRSSGNDEHPHRMLLPLKSSVILTVSDSEEDDE
jgi:hypothetical protein